ncbi:MAG: universal stress protein [Candidatus Bathyarchaeia archaeon]
MPIVKVMLSQKCFEKIIVPVDGSISCLRAQELAASIAKKFHSKVIVVHIVSHDFMHPELKAHHQLSPVVLQELDKVYLEAGQKILRQAKEFFLEEGVDVDAELFRDEDPAEKILEIAKDRGCDLIVIGNRAKTQSERFALGSVTEKVSLYAPCPVLITKGKTELRRLLVAVDGSAQANKAIDYAVAIAKKFEARITLVHVEESKLFSLKPDIAKKIGETILLEAEKKIEGIAFDRILKTGSPSKVISKMALAENFDLIVIGSRGMTSVKRFLLGSVSADVSMHARRSVLIIR